MSRRSVSLLIAITVGLVAVGLVVLLALAPAQRANTVNAAVVGEIAPETVGASLDGEVIDLRDRRGQWVLVNFFATWCTGCREEHPELIKFSERHAIDEKASVLGVVWSDHPDDVGEFFAKNGGDWPVLIDPGTIGLSYGVTAVPESYLVAPSGVIVQKFVGATGVTAEAIDSAIASFTDTAGSND